MNLKYSTALIAFLSICVIVLHLFFLFKIRANKRQDQPNESIRVQNRALYDSFLFTNTNADKLMENILVYSRMDQTFFLCDSIHSYTLVICVPPSQDICVSCIDHIIHSAQGVFDDFSQNKRIIILTHKDEPRLNSRVIKKPIFRYLYDDWLSAVEHRKSNPFYFVVDVDRKMSMFFMPNNYMPDLTTQYLNLVKKKYF